MLAGHADWIPLVKSDLHHCPDKSVCCSSDSSERNGGDKEG